MDRFREMHCVLIVNLHFLTDCPLCDGVARWLAGTMICLKGVSGRSVVCVSSAKRQLVAARVSDLLCLCLPDCP